MFDEILRTLLVRNLWIRFWIKVWESTNNVASYPINENRFKLAEQLALLTETSFRLKNKEFWEMLQIHARSRKSSEI